MKRIFAFVLALICLSMPLSALAKGNVKQVAEKLTYTNEDTVLPYRLLLPDNYDENAEYPLVVFFHGLGERGDDNELQFTHCVQYIYDNVPEDCIIVVPQCPLDNQWVDRPSGSGTYSTDDIPESNEINAVIELIDELKENYAVNSDRVYATGISMGGFAVWDVMTRHNDMFAAGIAVCSGGDPSKAEVLKDTPMFVFHGVYDMSVPVSGSRDTVEAIRNAGSTVIEYTEYPNGSHSIWNQAFAEPELLDKLFKCKLSDRITVTPESSEPESEVAESVVESETESETEPTSSTKTILFVVIGAILAIVAVVAVILIKKKK